MQQSPYIASISLHTRTKTVTDGFPFAAIHEVVDALVGTKLAG